MERRQNLMEDIEWEFKLLDEIKDGAISITNARYSNTLYFIEKIMKNVNSCNILNVLF